MKVIFWGTPKFSLPTLNAISDSEHEVLAVVTQPDKRRSRGNILSPSPVKKRALELGLNVFTPQDIRKQDDIQQQIYNLNADIYIVVAFGQLLPIQVLNQPPLGCWNSHASLLPRWRGAAPIQRCLMAGDSFTGVGIMAMEKGLDTGPILMEHKVAVDLLENADELAKRLSLISGNLIVEALHKIESAGPGSENHRFSLLRPRQQCETKQEAVYARLIDKIDTKIEWNQSCIEIHRKVMGVYPHAFTYYKGKRLKILSTVPLVEEAEKYIDEYLPKNNSILSVKYNEPGIIMSIDKSYGLIISALDSYVLVKEAQLEGKKALNGIRLAQQFNLCVGDKLE